MATHGSLSAFDSSKEDWSSYILRLKYYFEANEVTDSNKKKSSACGPATFRRIGSLLTTVRLESIGYEDLIAVVKNLYDPKPSIIVQRFQFNTRVRASSESIATYVAALRSLAEHCSYGDKLNEMLRDRLVCGVNHDTIQSRLLAEKDLTYEKAIELDQAVETAQKNAKIIKNGSTDSKQQGVHYTGSQGQDKKRGADYKKGTPICYRCGGPHLAPSCRFKETICHYCNKKGHLAKVCRARTVDKPSVKPSSKKNLYLKEDKDQKDVTYSMFTVRSNSEEPIMMEVHINNIPVKMELDTGASRSILSSSTYQFINQKTDLPPLQHSNVQLRTYTGEAIRVLGTTIVSVNYNNQEVVLPIHVVQGAGPDLMGRDWLEHFKVTNYLEQSLQSILDNHSTVFDNDLGCMKGVEIELQVKAEAKPKFMKPRTVPYILRQKVEEELNRLSNLGIISPVKTSKWAAPIVPVLKRDGTIRICGDFKTTFNQASDRVLPIT